MVELPSQDKIAHTYRNLHLDCEPLRKQIRDLPASLSYAPGSAEDIRDVRAAILTQQVGLYDLFCAEHPLAKQVEEGETTYYHLAREILSPFMGGGFRRLWPKVNPAYDDRAHEVIKTIHRFVGYQSPLGFMDSASDFNTVGVRARTAYEMRGYLVSTVAGIAVGFAVNTFADAGIAVVAGMALPGVWCWGDNMATRYCNRRRSYLWDKANEADNFVDAIESKRQELESILSSSSSR